MGAKTTERKSSLKAMPWILGGMAAVLLLWGLSDRYLWQDEAQTAVLAERMLHFGRPLAYDGVNLITVDQFVMEDAATISQRTTDPQAAIQYYIRRGDFKPDTSWRWQPWGQFIVDAISLKVLGKTTLAARLPFALAGVLAVVLLYRFVLTHFRSPLMATLAALLVVFNAYWILHCRQCRYYSLSSLLLLVTLAAYARWQWGARWGGAAFVIAAWLWFQVDYGTFWPVLLVLFGDAFVAQRHDLRRPALVAAVLAVSLCPFVYYFQLWRRESTPLETWGLRFRGNLFNMNEYVVPLVVVLAATALLVWRWRVLAATERRLILIACAVMVAFSLWVPSVTPTFFLRYVIIIAPLGCLLTAWVLVRSCGPHVSLAWLGAAVLSLTPWLSEPSDLLNPPPPWHRSAAVFRPELLTAATGVFSHRPDPNRIVIEWLRDHAAPTDEILINYEDVPLMFYLPNPIRGGMAAFRVEDDTKTPPEFVVLRRSVGAVHWPVYIRELQRYEWSVEPQVQAPDIPWGNNPDPSAQMQDAARAQSIFIARRIPRDATANRK